MGIELQALLVADHVYCDRASSKYVIAGTFHRLNVPACPCVFNRSVAVFARLANLTERAAVQIAFVDASTDAVLLHGTGIEVQSERPDLPLEFAIELPRLPLPHPGRYLFKLFVNEYEVGSIDVYVDVVEADA